MARKKVKLAWITNDASRKATFKKRKRGLMKKVSELSTLCGVNACAIVYSPYDIQPETWPQQYAEAHRIMLRFKDLPEMEQSKKMINQEGFLMQRIHKMKEQLQKQQRDNREKEITHLMYQTLAGKGLHDVTSDELSDLVWLIEAKMKAILERLDGLRNNDDPDAAAAAAAATIPPPPPPSHHHTSTLEALLFNGQHQYQQSFGGEHQNKTDLQMAMEALQRQTWFMDQMEAMNNNTNNTHEQMGNYFGDNHQEQGTQQVEAAGTAGGGGASYNDHTNNNNPWSNNSLFP